MLSTTPADVELPKKKNTAAQQRQVAAQLEIAPRQEVEDGLTRREADEEQLLKTKQACKADSEKGRVDKLGRMQAFIAELMRACAVCAYSRAPCACACAYLPQVDAWRSHACSIC